MADDYAAICRGAKYKLAGNGDRNVGMLLEAFDGADRQQMADVYGVGALINDFEEEVAELLGKPAAVFFPSGVMAQQIALRIWCDQAGVKRVAYHPTCHLEIHEEDGARQLHHLEPVLIGQPDQLFVLDDLAALELPVACLLIELPQREIGGQLPSWDDLVAIAGYAHEAGMRVHMDGARLFEALPYYDKTAAQVCDLFDSVYVSFYKGIGGVAGAMLAGDADFVAKAKVWKRRHGGDLISLYPYVVSARHHMGKRIAKMRQYWQHAVQVAAAFNKMPGVHTVPQVPVCNMFHVYFDAPAPVVKDVLAGIVKRFGVSVAPGIRDVDEQHCMAELPFGDSFEQIPPDLLKEVLSSIEDVFKHGVHVSP